MKEDTLILIVQPDTQVLRTQTSVLEEAGYRVAQAVSGHECLRLARDLRPDLVLLAADLPGGDGVELCRRIEADRSLREIFVVLVSTDAASTDEEPPADATVVGPVEGEDLLARLQAFLRIQRTERRLRASGFNAALPRRFSMENLTQIVRDVLDG